MEALEPSATKVVKNPKKETEQLSELLQGKLRPLVVCISHAWGGLEQIAANDCLELGACGIKPLVMVLSGSPIHEYLATRDEVEPYPLEFRPRDHFDLKLRATLLKVVEEKDINLIHTHQPTLLGSIIPWFYRRRNVSIVASRHIMNAHNKRDFFHTALYRRLDAMMVMSETLRANVHRTHSLKERQVKVVRYGIDFKKFDAKAVDGSELRKEWGVDDRTVLIGLVGRIDPAKGQETLLKALAGIMLEKKKSQKLKCVFVGEQTRKSGSNHLEDLKEMVQKFRLQDDVIFTGFREDIPQVMKALDIFVMPSRQEAFGLVAIEAMAMECPVIISNGGSAAEIVGREEFGYLVRPNDAFDLRRKLRLLIADPKHRAEMAKKGREYVRKNYDARIRIYRVLEVYERCLRLRGIRVRARSAAAQA